MFLACSGKASKDVSDLPSDPPAAKKARTELSMADIVATATTKVDVINPVEDFKKLLVDAGSSFESVCGQLEEVILKLLNDTLGRLAHAKAVRCLRAYREASLKRGSVEKFNNFMAKVKKLYSTKREDIWKYLSEEAVKLVSKGECPESKLGEEEVEKFYAAEKRVEEEKENASKDEEDLLNMM